MKLVAFILITIIVAVGVGSGVAFPVLYGMFIASVIIIPMALMSSGADKVLGADSKAGDSLATLLIAILLVPVSWVYYLLKK